MPIPITKICFKCKGNTRKPETIMGRYCCPKCYKKICPTPTATQRKAIVDANKYLSKAFFG